MVGTSDTATKEWQKGTIDSDDVMNKYMKFVYEEIFWHLSLQVFGSNMHRKKVYITT